MGKTTNWLVEIPKQQDLKAMLKALINGKIIDAFYTPNRNMVLIKVFQK